MVNAEGGGTREWRSAALPRYARMTRQVEALIAGRLPGGHQHAPGQARACGPVRGRGGQGRGQPHLAQGATDWEAWNGATWREDVVASSWTARSCASARSQGDEYLAAGRAGVRRDGQKVLWRCEHGRRKRSGVAQHPRRSDRPRPAHAEFLITDGGAGLERALPRCGPTCPPSAARCTSIAISWPTRPRRCTRRSRPTTPT